VTEGAHSRIAACADGPRNMPGTARIPSVSWRVVAWAARVLSAGALVAGLVLFVENVSGRWVSLS